MALRHVDPTARRGAAYRAWVRLTNNRPGNWLSRHIGWKVDPWLMRLTRGRIGVGLLLPTALLETRGARTGAVRRHVVLYFHDGGRPTIVASHLGLPTHPAWFHNLLARPDVVLGGEAFRATVVEDPGEWDRLWTLAVQVFPPFADYRRTAATTGRTIPLVRLEAT